MTKAKATKWVAGLLAAALLGGATPVGAQDRTPTAQHFYNEKLGWIGVATMVGGAMVMVPWKTEPGAEDWNLLGQDVCVVTQYQGEYGNNGNKFDIERHPCDTTTPLIKGGLITLGIGGALALVGFHKVRVTPTIGPHVAAAKFSVNW